VVPGVAAVDVSGGAREEVQVDVDLDRLQAMGVGLTQVLQALRSENQDISGGRLEGSRAEALTRTIGRFRTALEIENLSFLIPSADSAQPARRIFLRDFAKVVDGTEDERVLVRLNREPAVKLSVQKQPEANTVEVVKAVKSRMDALRQTGQIPPGTDLVDDAGRGPLHRKLYPGCGYLGPDRRAPGGWRGIALPGVDPPDADHHPGDPPWDAHRRGADGGLRLSLNIFSLGGLAIGVGAVDSCIVVLENIVTGSAERRKAKEQEGASDEGSRDKALPDGAAIGPEALVDVSVERAGELESALVASTTTNLVAVVPFLLIVGFVSLLFNELILTIAFTVGAALVTALTLVPMLASRLLAIPKTSGLQRLHPGAAVNEGFERVSRFYGRMLERALDRRRLPAARRVWGAGRDDGPAPPADSHGDPSPHRHRAGPALRAVPARNAHRDEPPRDGGGR
jgi:multidrug efflux pump subunit AcrB